MRCGLIVHDARKELPKLRLPSRLLLHVSTKGACIVQLEYFNGFPYMLTLVSGGLFHISILPG